MKRGLLLPALLAALHVGPALAGDAEVSADLDVFHADSTAAGPDAGAPEYMSAQELGIGLRARAHELDDKLELRLRYRGREPVAGQIQNRALRNLYELRASYAVTDWLKATGGRFIAPGPQLLIVDGLAAELELPLGLRAGAFAGRRGLTGNRVEAGVDKWLLATGASVGYHHARGNAQLHFNFAQDELLLFKGSSGVNEEPTAGMNLLLTGFARPVDWLLFGGQAGLVQQGTYVVGPTATNVELTAEVLNLLNAYGWVEWRPLKLVRATYDVHFQRPTAVRVGSVNADGDLRGEIVDPNYLDNKIKLAASPFGIGWVRAGVRHRLRPDRQELRYFAELDVNHLIPFGVYTRGTIMYEDMIGFIDNFDRVLGSLAVGYNDHGLDLGLGVRYLERTGEPISSRVAKAPSPQDLSPFLLEAQRILYLRAAYDARFWYAGVSVERSLIANEFRVLAQVGGRMELAW